jgi:hypothetical protein
MSSLATFLALPFLSAAAPADHPVLLPAHDALVAYHLEPAGGEAIDMRVAYLAGAKELRFNLPDFSYILVTPAKRSALMVVPLQNTLAELPYAAGPQSLFLLDDHARFTRKGEATVAGQKCTSWDMVLEQDRRTVCVTADGLVLRNATVDAQGRKSLVEATVVRTEPVPAELFLVPANYERIPLEAGPTR